MPGNEIDIVFTGKDQTSDALNSVQAGFSALTEVLNRIAASMDEVNKQTLDSSNLLSDLKTEAEEHSNILRGTADSAEQGAKRTNEALKDTKQTTEQTSKGFFDLQSSVVFAVDAYRTLEMAMTSLLSPFSALKGLLAESRAAWGAQRLATEQLRTAFTSMGRGAEGFQQVEAAAQKLQKETTFADESLERTAKRMSAFADISDEQMPRAMKVAADLAAYIGRDVETAARMLGMVSTGQGAMLKRLFGIPLSEATLKARDFDGALAEIEKRISGQGALVASGYGGRIKQIGNAWGDVQEQIGRLQSMAVTPVLKQIADAFWNVATIMEKGINAGEWEPAVAVINRIAQAISDLIVEGIQRFPAVVAAVRHFIESIDAEAVVARIKSIGEWFKWFFDLMINNEEGGGGYFTGLFEVLAKGVPIIAAVITASWGLKIFGMLLGPIIQFGAAIKNMLGGLTLIPGKATQAAASLKQLTMAQAGGALKGALPGLAGGLAMGGAAALNLSSMDKDLKGINVQLMDMSAMLSLIPGPIGIIGSGITAWASVITFLSENWQEFTGFLIDDSEVIGTAFKVLGETIAYPFKVAWRALSTLLTALGILKKDNKQATETQVQFAQASAGLGETWAEFSANYEKTFKTKPSDEAVKAFSAIRLHGKSAAESAKELEQALEKDAEAAAKLGSTAADWTKGMSLEDIKKKFSEAQSDAERYYKRLQQLRDMDASMQKANSETAYQSASQRAVAQTEIDLKAGMQKVDAAGQQYRHINTIIESSYRTQKQWIEEHHKDEGDRNAKLKDLEEATLEKRKKNEDDYTATLASEIEKRIGDLQKYNQQLQAHYLELEQMTRRAGDIQTAYDMTGPMTQMKKAQYELDTLKDKFEEALVVAKTNPEEGRKLFESIEQSAKSAMQSVAGLYDQIMKTRQATVDTLRQQQVDQARTPQQREAILKQQYQAMDKEAQAYLQKGQFSMAQERLQKMQGIAGQIAQGMGPGRRKESEAWLAQETSNLGARQEEVTWAQIKQQEALNAENKRLAEAALQAQKELVERQVTTTETLIKTINDWIAAARGQFEGAPQSTSGATKDIYGKSTEEMSKDEKKKDSTDSFRSALDSSKLNEKLSDKVFTAVSQGSDKRITSMDDLNAALQKAGEATKGRELTGYTNAKGEWSAGEDPDAAMRLMYDLAPGFKKELNVPDFEDSQFRMYDSLLNASGEKITKFSDTLKEIGENVFRDVSIQVNVVDGQGSATVDLYSGA